MKYQVLLIVFSFFLIGLNSCKTTKVTSDPQEGQVEEKVVAENSANERASSEERSGRRGERGGPRGERGAQDRVAYDAMVESLDLNQEQGIHFAAINESFQKKMSSKQEEARNSGSFEGMREEMAKLTTDQNGALKNLLTDKQYQIYSAFQEEQQKKREERRGQRGN